MKEVVRLVDTILMNADDEKTIQSVRKKVIELMDRFPLYPDLN
jgi:glycine/serine hydroxymethyltransferase